MRSVIFVATFMLLSRELAVAEGLSPVVAKVGARPAANYLENLSEGAQPDSPVDPSKPTVVITHGWNPAPRLVRLTTAQQYAERLRAKYGGQLNIFAWNWSSGAQRTPSLNNANALQSGQQLGAELLRRGIQPSRTTLIGHSMGSIVVTSAANCIKQSAGSQIAELCLLDAPQGKFDVVYRELCANGCANRVRNFWIGGLTGVGAPMDMPGIENVQAPMRSRSARRASSVRWHHTDILVWFYDHYL